MVVWLKHLELFKEVSTSLFQFSYLSVFGGAVENMIKKKKVTDVLLNQFAF